MSQPTDIVESRPRAMAEVVLFIKAPLLRDDDNAVLTDDHGEALFDDSAA